MKAKEDLRENLKVAKDLGWQGMGKKPAMWDVMARNVLSNDLGEFEDSHNIDYELDGVTRDRLIAHARQDAAMAYYAARAAHRQASAARLWSWVSFLILIIILFKVW